jgi:hypothetical protein
MKLIHEGHFYLDIENPLMERMWDQFDARVSQDVINEIVSRIIRPVMVVRDQVRFHVCDELCDLVDD